MRPRVPRQQTQNICITQRRPNVFDVGPTMYKRFTNVLCLLGLHCSVNRKALSAYFTSKEILPFGFAATAWLISGIVRMA